PAFPWVCPFFAPMRGRVRAAVVPAPLRGVSFPMTPAGLMSLAFMGFTGLIKI
ncbi:electron transport complex subunit RsxA, partial [Aeromonas veronii]